jgi:pectate lyase
VDIVHASDYVTVSWCVFRTQKKCSLVGHSDSNQSEDTKHLNVTFHHNYYVDVDERMPRMRFGNAHVFNLYSESLGGNGIQSTAYTATLVENSYFWHPKSGAKPTIYVNGGLSGIIKVVNGLVVNTSGTTSTNFTQNGQTNFVFNAPFSNSVPPYAYTMDVLTNVPNVVTNWAGVGKITSF